MPKKTRRMKERAALRRVEPRTSTPTTEPSAAVTEPAVRMRPGFVAPRTSLQDYDYSHIYGDLKRIALFAGFFFAARSKVILRPPTLTK